MAADSARFPVPGDERTISSYRRDRAERATAAERGKGLVLVVDDEPINTYVIRALLTDNGYQAIEAHNGEQAFEALRKHEAEVVICDIRMPRIDGEQVLRHVMAHHPTVPVIMLTGFIDVASAVHVMRLGAADYLTKPIEADETLVAVERALEKRRDLLERTRLEKENAEYRQRLEDLVRTTTRDIQQGVVEVMRALLAAVSQRDPYLFEHSKRVAQYAALVGREFAMNEVELRRLHHAGLLHDIGRIGMPDSLLDREYEPTEAEMQILRRHPASAVTILEPIATLRDLLPIIRSHHERFDGGGYPDALAGEAIPLESRILHLVDAFDALTNANSYRAQLSAEDALRELESCSGTQFDPEVVKRFAGMLRAKIGDRRTSPTASEAIPPDDLSSTRIRTADR